MFPSTTPTPVQNQQHHLQMISPIRSLPVKSLEPSSASFFPSTKNQWNLPPNMPMAKKAASMKTPKKDKLKQQNDEDIPYNIRILLDAEDKDDASMTSSDSEETDTMPEVFPNQWSFGLQESLRRKSEPFLSGSPLIKKTISSLQNPSTKVFMPNPPEKVTVKPLNFAPLNIQSFCPNDKRTYFVTLQGFNISTGRRIFRLDRLCSALQPRTPDEISFLYIDLWNDIQNGLQKENDNVFEPSSYNIPSLHFKLAMTVNMSHAYEDPYHIEFPVDLRQHALSSRDKKSQSLEIVYSDSITLNSIPASNVKIAPGNKITMHVHLSNESSSIQQPFSDNIFSLFPSNQSPSKQVQQSNINDWSIILRQLFIRLPLRRTQSITQHIPFVAPKEMPRAHNVYGKRGSAIVLGQGFGSPVPTKSDMQSGPMSPFSWESQSPDSSPTYKKRHSLQKDPELPPGIIAPSFGTSLELANQMPAMSLFKFRAPPQQRCSMQLIRNEPEKIAPKKRVSTDFSHFVKADTSPMKILESLAKATNVGMRRQSQTSNESTMSNTRFQGTTGSGDIDRTNQSVTTLNVSSFAESLLNIVPESDENLPKTSSDIPDEFNIEDCSGRMADLAKTNQGCKSLQKYVQNSDKEGVDRVLQELCERVGELMLDTYANYLIQTLVQKGTQQQRLKILQKMAPSFINIARDKKGTHSLQAVMAHVNSPEEFALIKSIIGHYVFDLSLDSKANYVIQKLVNTIPIEHGHFLYQPIFENFVQVANNSFGLLVLKQMMARVESNQNLKQRVVEFTCLNFEKLIQNPYGNYAIQYVIEYYLKDSQIIMSKILLKIIPYSSQKISSNVIEKCLAVCEPQFRRRVVEEILKNGRLGDLMKNKYGNFVALQLLATSIPNDKQRLMQEILRCANAFNGTKYKTRWLKFIQENPMKIDFDPSASYAARLNEINLESSSQSGEILGMNGQCFNTESLEAVKRIWREMTKEEKGDAPPYQHGKGGHGKRNY